MAEKTTNNGRKGGWLKGKPHHNSQGKPMGGIKAVITDSGRHVELEGGEVIINKEASAQNWKKLSEINQSAGGGVPIGPPDSDVNQYEKGGNIDFNVNHVPNPWIISYGQKLKTNYPKIWALTGNVYGNEAFENLARVQKRGHWLDSEEWMYAKWRTYASKNRKATSLEGVINMLKWGDKVDKGWPFMKALIEKEIAKTELAKGVKEEKEHKGTAKKLYAHKIKPSQAPKSIAKEHLKQNPKYYSELATLENMADGGTVTLVGGTTIKVGDTGIYTGKTAENASVVRITSKDVFFVNDAGEEFKRSIDSTQRFFKLALTPAKATSTATEKVRILTNVEMIELYGKTWKDEEGRLFPGVGWSDKMDDLLGKLLTETQVNELRTVGKIKLKLGDKFWSVTTAMTTLASRLKRVELKEGLYFQTAQVQEAWKITEVSPVSLFYERPDGRDPQVMPLRTVQPYFDKGEWKIVPAPVEYKVGDFFSWKDRPKEQYEIIDITAKDVIYQDSDGQRHNSSIRSFENNLKTGTWYIVPKTTRGTTLPFKKGDYYSTDNWEAGQYAMIREINTVAEEVKIQEFPANQLDTMDLSSLVQLFQAGTCYLSDKIGNRLKAIEELDPFASKFIVGQMVRNVNTGELVDIVEVKPIGGKEYEYVVKNQNGKELLGVWPESSFKKIPNTLKEKGEELAKKKREMPLAKKHKAREENPIAKNSEDSLQTWMDKNMLNVVPYTTELVTKKYLADFGLALSGVNSKESKEVFAFLNEIDKYTAKPTA